MSLVHSMILSQLRNCNPSNHSSEIWRLSARWCNLIRRVARRWRRVSKERHSRRSQPCSAVWLRLPVRTLVLFYGVVRVRGWACCFVREKDEGLQRGDASRKSTGQTRVLIREIRISHAAECQDRVAFVMRVDVCLCLLLSHVQGY